MVSNITIKKASKKKKPQDKLEKFEVVFYNPAKHGADKITVKAKNENDAIKQFEKKTQVGEDYLFDIRKYHFLIRQKHYLIVALFIAFCIGIFCGNGLGVDTSGKRVTTGTAENVVLEVCNYARVRTMDSDAAAACASIQKSTLLKYYCPMSRTDNQCQTNQEKWNFGQ